MMKTLKTLILLVLMMLCTTIGLNAQEEEARPENRDEYFLKTASVSLKASTLGGGLEVATTLSEHFSLRLGWNYFVLGINKDYNDYDLNLDTKIRLNSLGLLADWHPGGRHTAFHLTGGLFLSSKQIDVVGTPLKTYEVAGFTYTPEDIGTLTMKFNTGKVNPYLGAGFGTAVPRSNVSFKIEFGALYHGSPGVDMYATGMIKPTEGQEGLVKNNISDYQFWPVMSMQLCIRIF